MLEYEVDETLKHAESLDKRKIKLLGFISFLMGFSQALVIYIISSYFKAASGIENVGIFYLVSYAVALAVLLHLHKVVKSLGKSAVFYLSSFLKIMAIAFLMILPLGYWVIVFLVLYLILGTIEWVSLDTILESFSIDNMSGRIRGRHLTFINAGFLLGPFLSSYIIEKYGFNEVFLLLFLVSSIVLILSIVGIRQVNHVFSGEIKAKEIISKVLKKKNILRIYYVSFALELFYAMMVIYTSLYLIDIGLPWEKIGVILSIMLVPFVLVQYPMGIIADKKLGEKEMIIVSLIIMAASTASIFYIKSTSVLIWGVVLFTTRIGAALLEVLRDSYFYKRIDASDVDLINFFRTSTPLAYIIATFFSTILLLFFPMRSIFIFAAFVVVSALLPAIFLVDNKCEKELEKEKAV